MITEGTTSSNTVRFKLNGKVKTISQPVTGAALHVLAGSPASLTVGGKEIPNDREHFDLKQDAEVHSKHHLAQPETLSTEQILPGGPAGVDPGPPLVNKANTPADREKILDEVAAGHGGPYADKDDDTDTDTDRNAARKERDHSTTTKRKA